MMYKSLVIGILVVPSKVTLGAGSYPHAHSYQSHVWEEYNLGSVESMNIHLTGNAGSSSGNEGSNGSSGSSSSNSAPSHIHLCRALLNPEAPTAPDANSGGRRDILIVEEEDVVCRDYTHPFKALWTMFTSSLIAHVAHIQGKSNVFYEHSCGTDMARITSNPQHWMEGTIQQLMPPFLKLGMDITAEQYTVPLVLERCQTCVNEYDRALVLDKLEDVNRKLRFPQCLLAFDGNGQDPTLLEKAATDENALKDPMMRGRLRHRQLVQEFPNATASILAQDHDHLHLHLIRALLPSIKSNLRQAAEEWRNLRRESSMTDKWVGNSVSSLNGYTEQRSQGVVIYLDCAHGDCLQQDSVAIALPYLYYATKIPRSTVAVEILTTKSCWDHIGGCNTHAVLLRDFLRSYLPDKQVSMEVFDVSTGGAYARMMLAGRLLAPPSLGVVFPALAKPNYSTLVQSRAIYPYMDALSALQGRRDLPLSQTVGGMEVLMAAVVPTLVSPFPPDAPQMDQFMKSPLHPALRPSQCRNVRGRYGRWILDGEYAKHAQYASHILGYAGNADLAWKRVGATEEHPFRDATQYRWMDHFMDSCPVEIMTRQKLCATLHSLGIERLFFVGDSLSFHWSQAIWKLLKGEETPGSDSTLDWSLPLECFGGMSSIEMTFVRNDKLDATAEEVTFGTNNCGFGYCTSWRTKYGSSPKPTLLVANTGPHQYEQDVFKADMDDFIHFVQGTNRTSDIVMLRTTAPGHPNCTEARIPYENYDEFAHHADYTQRPYSKFNWHMFPMYNRYVDSIIHKDMERATGYGEKAYSGPSTLSSSASSSSPQFELLDIVPMTVLRPDGHVSGPQNMVNEYMASDKCKNCKPAKDAWAVDCLHYSLPGPIDWWSHLLFTTLQDIAAERNLAKAP